MLELNLLNWLRITKDNWSSDFSALVNRSRSGSIAPQCNEISDWSIYEWSIDPKHLRMLLVREIEWSVLLDRSNILRHYGAALERSICEWSIDPKHIRMLPVRGIERSMLLDWSNILRWWCSISNGVWRGVFKEKN